MNLEELKKKSPAELIVQAEKLEIENPSTLRKQEILFAILKKLATEIDNSPITPDNLGQLIKLIISNRISGKIAKDVFEYMYKKRLSPEEIVNSRGLVQVTNTKEIELIINQILKLHYDKVNDYKAGKTKLLGFFVGQAMQVSKGKINPKMLNDILIKKLS